MQHGSMRCPRHCATAPLVRHCRPSSISISTNWPASSRRAVSGETDSAVPRRDRGTPTGVHRYPRAVARCALRGARSRRGSPLWTPWTSRSGRTAWTVNYAARGVNSSCRQGVNSGCRLTPRLRYCRPADRRSIAQRWRDAVGELLDLQGAYRSWSYSLPANVADSATAEALRAICEIDLTELNSVDPPRGFGRDN